MITLRLDTIALYDNCTIGRLTTPLRTFWTLEDKVREIPNVPVNVWKVKGETAIPAGRYELVISFSNRFQKPLPLLVDVPGYTGVRIHTGNTEKDTEGCILIGTGLSSDSKMITNSRVAMDKLMMELDSYYDVGMPVEIIVNRSAS